MNAKPWQLQILDKSLKKKEKLRLIDRGLDVRPGTSCLDLGCAQGMLSYFLERKGGTWVHIDQDLANLKTARGLVPKNLIQTGNSVLPFRDRVFDFVVCLDYLEHLDDDNLCLAEIGRILKDRGRLILVTPHTGRFYLLHKLRPALGMKLEFYGHKREGYGLNEIETMLRRHGLCVTRRLTYSKFFSELFELLINAAYVRVLARKKRPDLRDGRIKPSDASEFEAQKRTFRLYKLIYPFVWLVAQLDHLLFFMKGYCLMVWAEKTPAPPRRSF